MPKWPREWGVRAELGLRTQTWALRAGNGLVGWMHRLKTMCVECPAQFANSRCSRHTVSMGDGAESKK